MTGGPELAAQVFELVAELTERLARSCPLGSMWALAVGCSTGDLELVTQATALLLDEPGNNSDSTFCIAARSPRLSAASEAACLKLAARAGGC